MNTETQTSEDTVENRNLAGEGQVSEEIGETAPGGPVEWGRDVEPWPEAVNGALLLDELAAVLGRFVVLPKWATETLALWILHTYAFELRTVSTYIGIESPEKRCGKTTLLTVLSELVNRPVVAANISPPAFFRVIEEERPTLLIDEADTFLQGNDELRGILNAGYSRKTAFVVRVGNQVSAGQSPRSGGGSRLARFSCWCPKVMAAIGRLPETLADRCIVIRMQRKGPVEACERLRTLAAMSVRRQCARFVLDHADRIASARSEIPASLNDRAGDIWEPLLALADLAGEGWPEKARQAAAALTAGSEESSPIAALLLDLMMVFALGKADRMFSRDVVAALNDLVSRPWAEERAPITELRLARRLKPYGIRPVTVRIGDTVGRGYVWEDMKEPIQRYIPRAEARVLLGREEEEGDLPTDCKDNTDGRT